MNYLLVKIFRIAFSIIPLSFARKIGYYLGYLSSYMFKREIKIAQTQINTFAKRLNINPEDSIHVTRKVFANIGISFVESLFTKKILKIVPPQVTIDNPAALDKLIKGGGIVISAHYGSFELLASFYCNLSNNIYITAREANYKLLDTFVKQLREEYGGKLVWRSIKGGEKTLLKAIKNKHIISCLIDQDIMMENNFYDFMGLKCAYPSGLVQLATNKKLPIYVSIIQRQPDFTHKISLEEINYDHQSSNAIDQVIMQYSKILESKIRETPEQWIWWHRRWRRLEGEEHVRSTNEYLEWLKTLNIS